MAAISADKAPLLRVAMKAARRLEHQQLRWTSALAQLIRAGVASVRGEKENAVQLLAEATRQLESADMDLFAASTRRHLGQLRGGNPGRELVEQADGWMRSQLILNPSRMAACLAPGFARTQTFNFSE